MRYLFIVAALILSAESTDAGPTCQEQRHNYYLCQETCYKAFTSCFDKCLKDREHVYSCSSECADDLENCKCQEPTGCK